MKVAWFTPLPPMPSGIADYSSEIVPYVTGRADVDVFCPRPGLFSRARVPAGATLRAPREFDRLRESYDACFYHLGNNPYHEFVYKVAKDHPAIAVFHDADLHHLIAHVTIEARRDPVGYEEILREELGRRGERLATLRRLGAATEFEKFVFPLTAHVATRARGIVVHSEDARLRLNEVAPDVPITVVPHHAGEPPAEIASVTREEARRRLDIPQDAFVVAHLGFITKPKQPAAVVGGFAALFREFPDSMLYMVGSDRTGGGLARLVDDLGVRSAVRMAGYVDLTHFYLYLKALDVMINLRYPSAGESSGTFSRALAEGRTVIVNNYGSFAEVPPDVALKVEIDAPQAEQVGGHLLHLARDAEFRARTERRAREYAATVLDPVRCRDLYLAFAEQVAASGPTAAPRARPLARLSTPTLSDAVVRHHRVSDMIELAHRGTLGSAGNAAFVDLAYRVLLRRPAEDDAIRDAHAALAAGTSRARLVERIVNSREFAEISLLDDLVRQAGSSDRPFTIDPGPPIGPDTTERVVEIPWMLSRWRGAERVLDAGYAFASHTWTSALSDLRIPSLHGVDRAIGDVPEMVRAAADLRALPFRDEVFDLVYCISTLEHVGRPNPMYGLDEEPEDPEAMATALGELARVVAAEGRILLSVPFGRLQDLGWLLQLDWPRWESLLESTPLRAEELELYRLSPAGWIRTDDLAALEDLSYGDGAPAARGVLCATLVKSA